MEGNKKAEDKLNIVNVITVGVVGVLLVWVSVVALQTYYKSTLDEEEARRMTQGQEADLVKVQAAQRAQLGGYAMRSSAAASKKVAVIPIDRAMDLVVQDLKAKPDASVVPEVGAQDKATIHAFPPFEPIKTETPPAAPGTPPATPETPPATPETPPTTPPGAPAPAPAPGTPPAAPAPAPAPANP